jgi:GNAT superfamily N-acetyltransferase
LPRYTCHELTPARWADLERLFGDKGACAGCWCMFWRVPSAELKAIQGATAKKRLRVLVEREEAHGVLAYQDGEPVGWCSFERRVDLPRLDRAPSLKITDDPAQVWSLPCFFVKAGHRGQGVASALLSSAEKLLRRRGAKLLEAYPLKPSSSGKIPAAFAWTGVPALFEAAGWTLAAARDKGKQRYRKKLR